METRTAIAVERKKTCNCAQAVIATYADLVGITQEHAMNLGNAFGSGMVAKFMDVLRAEYNRMPDAALQPMVDAVNAMLLEGKAALTAAFAIAGSAALLLYPLWFVLIKKAVCSDTAEAECVDVQTTLGYKDYHPRYRAIWMYEYNGTTYLHRDMTSYKSPVYNERKTIRLSPRYPHNIYTGKLPVSAFFISAAGFFFLAFLLLFLQPLM